MIPNLKILVLSGAVSGILFLVGTLGSIAVIANPIGSLSAMTSWLALLVPLALYLAIKSKKRRGKLLNVLAIIFFIVIISLINFLIGWIVLGVAGFASLVVLMTRKDASRNWATLPMFILILAIIWQFFSLTPVYRLDLPAEVSLGRSASFEVAKNTVHSGVKPAVLGSGPSTFQFDFSRFRSSDFNENPLWQVRFSQAQNQLLEAWSTTGYLGAALLIVLLGLALIVTFVGENSKMLLPVWISLLVLGWYGVFAIPAWLILFVLLANSLPKKMTREVNVSLEKNSTYSLISSSGFVLGVVAIVLFFGFLTKVYLADYYFRVGEFQKAADTNPSQSAYHMSLASDSLRKATELAQSLDSEDPELAEKQNEVRSLIALAINRSQEATRRAPNNAGVWQLRGNIFKDARAFSLPEDQFVKDANDWIVSSLTQAIELEPNNPTLYLDLGLVYESQGETEQAIEEITKSVELKTNLAASQYELGRIYYNESNDEKAVEHLENAVILNQDFANALYSLALAYERTDRINEAAILLTRVSELNPDNEGISDQLKRLEGLTTEETEETDEE